jgi:hypothetical protein
MYDSKYFTIIYDMYLNNINTVPLLKLIAKKNLKIVAVRGSFKILLTTRV